MPWPSLETIALLEDEGGQCSMAGVASVGVQQEYAIGGVTVKFPCKPYRTQMAMMSKVCCVYQTLVLEPFCQSANLIGQN